MIERPLADIVEADLLELIERGRTEGRRLDFKRIVVSRSQQSSAKATRTFSPLSQPISNASEHQRVLRRRAVAVSLT